MYLDSEVGISRGHLGRVLASLEDPVLLLGGWAVYLQVVDGYREATGRDYLGSRDIDLGFSIQGDDLESTPFAHATRVLMQDLGFKPLSFRLMREYDNETGEPLEPEASKRMPVYRIFQMYIDLMVDRVPDGFEEVFGFTPPDEPLLAQVFEDVNSRREVEAFGRVLWMPAPSVLLRMKVRSFPNRTRDHKRIKDLADIAALVLFTDLGDREVVPEELEEFLGSLEGTDLEEASSTVGLGLDTIETALNSIR